MLAIQISRMHRCTKLYPNVSILSLQESLQENISHLLSTYFAFPCSFPALSILQSAEPSRAGKISLFPLLFEHCNSNELSRRQFLLYTKLPKASAKGRKLLSRQNDFFFLPKCLFHCCALLFS